MKADHAGYYVLDRTWASVLAETTAINGKAFRLKKKTEAFFALTH